MINYVQGDATEPIGSGNRVIIHICNDKGGWGKGFVLALSAKWSRPESAYRNWYRIGETSFSILEGNSYAPFELGQTQFVWVDGKLPPAGEYGSTTDNLWVGNMIAQEGYRTRGSDIPLRYEALEQCLTTVARFAKQSNASVHMPRIGTGLAGGDWSLIEPIINRTLLSIGIDVTVYDL